jgi:hypothetical protein
MTFSTQKLVAIVNLLSDPGSAANAASILAREAKERGLLVADLIAQATSGSLTAPRQPDAQPAARQTEPGFADIGDGPNDDGPYVRRIDSESVGLVSEIIAETTKAWRVELPGGTAIWLAKSVVDHHGEDPQGRSIFTVPCWLARKGGISAWP